MLTITTGISESEARLQLARADCEAQEKGTTTLHEVTPAAMIVELLEIEDLQYVLDLFRTNLDLPFRRRRFARKYSSEARDGTKRLTATQEREMLSRRSAIRRRLTTVRAVQAIYTPCVPALVASHLRTSATSATSHGRHGSDRIAESRAEDEPLFLPSSLGAADRESCASGVADAELLMRDAQLHECLDQVRVLLHVKAGLVMHKNKHFRHQRQNTRARTIIETNDERLQRFADKYRAAREAKIVLSGTGEWEKTWRVLNDTDIRTMLAEDDPVNAKVRDADKERQQLLSEGRRVTSWIWMGADKGGVEGSAEESMQDGTRFSVSPRVTY